MKMIVMPHHPKNQEPEPAKQEQHLRNAAARDISKHVMVEECLWMSKTDNLID